MMSRLTIHAVHTKKQVYPVIINFQNGYPTDDFEIDCALVLQGENSIRTIATEVDELVYAGQEDYEDLGRTFILARDKNTGKVRLIESGSADLKPQNEDNNQLLEKNKLEAETSTTTSHMQQEIDKIVTNRLNYIPVLRECGLEPDMANYLAHEETSFVNPSIDNHFEQLNIPDSSNTSQFNTDVFEPGKSNSPQKLNNECGEPDLNMLFSIAPEYNELEPNKYDCAEQDTCESELNITNSLKQLEITKIQRQQTKTNFKETIESESNQLQQVEDKLEVNKELDLKKSNLSQPLETAELEYDINYTEQLSQRELETGLQIQIVVEVLDLNRLPGEAGLTEEASLPDNGGLAGKAGLIREAIGEACLPGEAGLNLQHEKNKVDPNTAKTLEDQETSICEQTVTNKTQVTDANEIEFDRLFVEKHSIVPEQANDDENVEKDIDELNLVDLTTEQRDDKYNHMMNYYHDEPNNSKTNLTNNNEKRKCFQDFSTVKEMFIESLGLKLKVHKKLKTQNVIHKNHMNKQKNNVFITHGHKAIINKQSNDDNKTPNIFSYKYNKQALESQTYTCDYCKNVFEDKDSLIIHLVSHKFIRNTKNVVLKPLVERIIEVANTKSHTCRIECGNHKRYKKKRSGLDSPENRNSTLMSNTVVNSTTTEKIQSFNENDQTINNAENRPIHFTNGSETAGNLYICNHCKERLKDKDSLIFHFGTCINSLKTSENVKARKDNFIQIYDDATTNREAHKAEESAAVNTEQTGHMQELCNEIKIADNFENCPIHLEKDSSRENNESQIIPERNYICEHCEKMFQEKGSLIFHLVAHKINNTIGDTAKENTHKTKYDRNNTIGEKTKCLQSSENIIDTIEISEYESKTICDKDAKNNELRYVKENCMSNSIDDVIQNHEANKLIENILVNPEENENREMYTEVEITDNSRKPEANVSNKNQNIVKTCAYDCDGTLNYTQKLTPEEFKEKGHILHLGAHQSSKNIRKLSKTRKGYAKTTQRHKTIRIAKIGTSNSRINRSHSKEKINSAINVRQLRSSNKNQKHKDIVHIISYCF